jgi:hypothetical protein
LPGLQPVARSSPVKEAMTNYIENPKTRGSGIICAIPQRGACPVGCPDCFFQSGRSYLEPLAEHTPNLPSPEQAAGRVVRCNDGNDSNHDRAVVMAAAELYRHVFFNTSIPHDLAGFQRPVVLTVNPGDMTDTSAHLLDPIPPNLMFVRVRTNAWNTDLVRQVVEYYTPKQVPVVLTYMAYYHIRLPPEYSDCYTFRQRTMNSYYCITPAAAAEITAPYSTNAYVYSCGKDVSTYACARCGHCLREYFATQERLRVDQKEEESLAAKAAGVKGSSTGALVPDHVCPSCSQASREENPLDQADVWALCKGEFRAAVPVRSVEINKNKWNR